MIFQERQNSPFFRFVTLQLTENELKAKIELNLKPFSVPNFVQIDGEDKAAIGDESSIPLHMVDKWTLEKMCEEFTDAVFKKAKRNRPPTQAD